MRVKFPAGRGPRLVLVLVAIVVLLAADGVYAGLRFRSTFKAAACDLKKATDRIEDFDVTTAIDRLERAEDGVRAARGFLGHPAVALATYLPWAGTEIRVLKALSGVARDAVDAGLNGARAAQAMGLGEGSLGSIYTDGRVQFDALGDASAALTGSMEDLDDAARILDAAPSPRLGPVRSAFFGARRLVADAQERAVTARAVLDALPGIFGSGGVRRYFLAFQTPSEARAGGGLIGVYGILRIADGKIGLEKIAPIRNLVPKLKHAVTGPGWFRHLYGNLDGLRGWREANQSPSFPTVARILLRMYDASVGDRLDGVIAMDPFVVADLTRGTGPIEAPGLDVEVGPENAAEVLLKDIYLEFEGREDDQNAYLRALVDQLWERLAEGDIDAQELAKGIAHSIRTRHLRMFSLVPTDQDALEETGLTSDPTSYGPNVQMVFHNNFAANKVDYFLERTQKVQVVVDPDGDAQVVTTVTLFNGAPKGERSLLKKSDVNTLPSGLNRMSLHFMLPEGSVVKEFFTGGVTNTYFSGKESGLYPVAWRLVDIQVQETVRLAISYTVPDMVSFTGGRATFDMTLLPQGLVTPDHLDLRVVAPEGFRLGKDQPGSHYSTNPFTYTGPLNAPKTVRLQMIAAGETLPDASSLGSACS